MPQEIMYIGKKPTKVDNKNNIQTRIWRGLGQVIGGIPDLEAEKLTAHPDIWMNVTKMNKAQRTELIAALQEQYRAQARRDREGQIITLDNASDEEIETALRKRRALRGKAADNPIDKKNVGVAHPKGTHGNESEIRERPENSDDLGSDIYGALMALDKEKDFDAERKPYLERVNEQLGYSITQKELDDVWSALTTKA